MLKGLGRPQQGRARAISQLNRAQLPQIGRVEPERGGKCQGHENMSGPGMRRAGGWLKERFQSLVRLEKAQRLNRALSVTSLPLL